MKKKIGVKTIKKKDIIYPSPRNPRLATLSAKDSSVIALAKSIQKNDLQYPPIVLALPNGKYEAIDGDRRLVAVFDILKWDEVEATVWEIDNDLELFYLKLATNWDRQDFSSMEKGRYLYTIAIEEVAKDGLNIDEVWSQRTLRHEYIRRIADNLAKSKSMVSRNIGLWLSVPRESRNQIAQRQEDVIQGKVTPATAFKVITQGKKLGDVEGVWNAFIPKKGPVKISVKEIDLLAKKIRSGQIVNTAQVIEFRKQKTIDNWKTLAMTVTREEEVMASKLASALETSKPSVIRACIHLGFANQKALSKIVPKIGV